MTIKIDWSKYEGVGNNPVKQQSSISNTINDVLDNDTLNKAKGYAGQAGNSFLLYQAPHIVGAIKEYANLRNKVNNLDYKNLFKDFGKSYIEGRENTKKELNEFRQENPKSSFVAELAGGIGSGGAVSTLGKAFIKKAIPRAIAEGGLYGSLAGASNTEGKGFDPLGATIGTIAGGAGGAALSTLGKLARKVLLSKNTGKVGEMITPAGIHEDTINNIVTDPKVAEAVANGNIGKKVGTYSTDVQNSLSNLKETVSNLKKQAYEGINGKTKINLDKTVNNISKEVKNIKKNIGSDTKSKNILKETEAIIQDMKKASKTKNQIELGRLKNLKDRINRLKNSAFETDVTGKQKRLVSEDVVNMLDNAYSSLAKVEKSHSPQLKYANEFYSDMSKVAEELANIKLYDEDTAAKSAARLGRDISGNVFKLAENKVKNILGKYETTKGLGDELFTNMKKLQVAKNIKPDSNYGVLQTPIKMAKNILTGGNREQKMQTLAQAIKDGKVTKAMLDKEINKGKIAVAPFIDYYLALSKVPQANLASNAISKVLPKNSKDIFERNILPRATMRYILDKYYNKEQ